MTDKFGDGCSNPGKKWSEYLVLAGEKPEIFEREWTDLSDKT